MKCHHKVVSSCLNNVNRSGIIYSYYLHQNNPTNTITNIIERSFQNFVFVSIVKMGELTIPDMTDITKCDNIYICCWRKTTAADWNIPVSIIWSGQGRPNVVEDGALGGIWSIVTSPYPGANGGGRRPCGVPWPGAGVSFWKQKRVFNTRGPKRRGNREG